MATFSAILSSLSVLSPTTAMKLFKVSYSRHAYDVIGTNVGPLTLFLFQSCHNVAQMKFETLHTYACNLKRVGGYDGGV